jgi:DNA-binding NarL/FixJ family response regulator
MLINVAIAEDNRLALKTCLDRLARYPGIKVVCTAYNGLELVNYVKGNREIDIALVDIVMPEMDGIEAASRIAALNPNIKILMLTTIDDDEHIFKAIMAGASGYVLKEENAEALYNRIMEALNGGAGMSAGIALRVINMLRDPRLRTGGKDPKEQFGISSRELELLELLKNGLTYEQIAAKLFISYGTVRKHIENIYRKLQVNNKVNAIDKAARNNLI